MLRGGWLAACLTHGIPDAACCEETPEPLDTRVQVATPLTTPEGVTGGGHNSSGDGLHAAEDPTPVRARRQAVKGQGPVRRVGLHGWLSGPRSGLRATPGAAPATHHGLRAGTGGLGALDPCSSAARQRVPVCAAVAHGDADKGAQGTATPFREVAERIPSRRGKRGACRQARWRDLNTHIPSMMAAWGAGLVALVDTRDAGPAVGVATASATGGGLGCWSVLACSRWQGSWLLMVVGVGASPRHESGQASSPLLLALVCLVMRGRESRLAPSCTGVVILFMSVLAAARVCVSSC